MTSMETPRLLSESVAASAQSERSISARADVAVTSSAQIHTVPAPPSEGRKGRGCSPEPPDANVTTRIFGRLRSIAPTWRLRPIGTTAVDYRARDREIPLPQFFDVWQFLEIAQPKVIEEELRRFIEKRAPGDFCASSDFHQAALHQCLQYTVDIHTANRFHISACNGLPVCDDRQSFQRRRTQPRRLRCGEKLADPLGVLRIGRKLPAFRLFYELKGALLLDVLDLQFLKRGGT